jgi:hypothetical protein
MTSLSGVSAELLAPKACDEGVSCPTPLLEVYITYYDGKGTCGKLACLEIAPSPNHHYQAMVSLRRARRRQDLVVLVRPDLLA